MQEVVDLIAEAIELVDRSGIPFKSFQLGAGPYGEPQLVKLIANHLSSESGGKYEGARTCRNPDVLIPKRWALEFKIVRPFGDNGIEAEHWSQNLLHPYPGNVSAIGDAFKLIARKGEERRGLVVICFEHDPPKIDLSVLINAFELVSSQLLRLPIGRRYSKTVTGCVHPVHQRATILGWSLD